MLQAFRGRLDSWGEWEEERSARDAGSGREKRKEEKKVIKQIRRPSRRQAHFQNLAATKISAFGSSGNAVQRLKDSSLDKSLPLCLVLTGSSMLQRLNWLDQLDEPDPLLRIESFFFHSSVPERQPYLFFSAQRFKLTVLQHSLSADTGKVKGGCLVSAARSVNALKKR